jgi:serine/threonine protein kinase
MPANPVTHPPADALRAYGLGKLDDTTAEGVLRHLESCPDCRRLVATQPGDSFLDRLRDAHGSSGTPHPSKSLTALTKDLPAAVPVSAVPNLPPELANNPQYEILRELGRGGMGVVYLAKNRLMDRLEVLKVVNRALLDKPQAAERFLREIRAAAKLSHNNVVKAHSALMLGELLVFAMEYVEGDDLDKVVKQQGPLPVAHACYYAYHAALGLQHAHEHQMVHRDIKPHNLILSRQGKKHIVKVLDFGLAKATREGNTDPALTGEGMMLGTPAYIAPEQARDAAGADIRADIYSLGCTLYYLLTGTPPFPGTSAIQVLHGHLMREATPLSQVRQEVPAELAAVVAKMMAKDPAQRYQKPIEVAQALAPFVKSGSKSAGAKGGSQGGVVDLPPFGEAGSKSVPPTLPTTAGGTGPEGWRAAGATRPAKKRWRIGAAVAAAVLLLGLVGLWATGMFRVKTADGILVLDVSEPNADVFVDGEKVTVSWADGGKTAVIRVKPGTRKVEVKKDGFTAFGEEVEFQDSQRRVLTARLVSRGAAPAPAEGNAGDYDLTRGYRLVHFGPGGPRVVLFFNDFKKQYFARVYDLATGQALTPPLKHEDWVFHASFSPDGNRVVTASCDKTARVWDAATGEALTPPLKHEGDVHCAAFSPDGKRVVTASPDKTARVWDAATGEALTPPLKHDDRVFCAAFSPDGKRVVTGGWDKTARVWDAATGKELTPPLKHEDSVFYAAFSPDGKRVVTAPYGTARLWDAATGKELKKATITPD